MRTAQPRLSDDERVPGSPTPTKRVAAYPHRTTHAAGWSHRCADDGQDHGRARPQKEDGPIVVGECRRAGAGAGGPFWGWGRSGRVRPVGAARNHPHRCHPHATARTADPVHTGTMIEGTPAPLHPPSMAATEHTHAPLPGLPKPHSGENRLHPLATELYRRDTAAISRALARPHPAAWARI